jgi:hypothetical protein
MSVSGTKTPTRDILVPTVRYVSTFAEEEALALWEGRRQRAACRELLHALALKEAWRAPQTLRQYL